ncbi:MAG TPA: PQQ-binding-like beta-propeller repeat protein, partial [Tepidisphaeraceae bacterium]|nr:PQQ-binding-like beta-propeller repeat protein [Tepidisphaeraceae bacterium]
FSMPQRSEPRLVCLDRETGKQVWIATPSQFPQESLRTLQLGGAPLVTGDNVLLVATASKQAGFEDCYVLSFDVNKGTLRWATNIASSSTAAAAFAGFNPNFLAAENESHLAYANGRVYVETNRGAVAAVDAYNGTIAWIDIYPRGQQALNPAMNPMFFQQGGAFSQNQTKPWTFNPVIVSQGMVFTLPMEGKNLLIYDAVTGAEVKRIDLEDLAQRLKDDEVDRTTFDTLVGVVGNKLVLAGAKAVVAINWKTYDSAHYDDNTMLLWDEPSPAEMRGRPFLTQDWLYQPLADRLYILNLTTGRAEKEYPIYPRTWGDDEGPGNIVVTSDHAVIAGATHVDVYTDLAAAKQKLDRAVAEAPQDPQPRLRYAEVMYAAGDYDTSMAKLDEAIERLGGIDSLKPGPARDRLFNDALTFAQKLKTDPRTSGRERIEKLFDRAKAAADSPQEQVQYRMARAGFDEIKGDVAAAVELYQQVLSQPDMRAVSLPDESQKSPVSADEAARQRIADIIKRDPSVYEPFEKQAGDALKQAQESNDPAKLLSVAQSFPNSTVAPKAMLLAADAYEAAGDSRSARHVLLDVYFNHDKQPTDRAQILEALARTDPRTAAHMLSQGTSDLGDPRLTKPLKLSDGTEVSAGTTFSTALKQVRALVNREQVRALPAFAIPKPPRSDIHRNLPPFRANSPVIDNVAALLVPLRDFARNDRIVTWSSAPLLSVYPPDGSKPVSTCDQITEQPAGCAWMGNDLLVWSPTHLWRLKNATDVTWKLDIGHLPTIEVLASDQPAEGEAVNPNLVIRRQVFVRARGGFQVVAAPAAMPGAPKPAAEGPERIDQVVPASGRIILSTTTGRVLSVESDGGRISWQTRLTDRPIDRLLADEDFTVVQATNDLEVRLAVLDTFTGHVRGSKSFLRSTNSFPQNVALSPDGTLVYTLPDRIRIQDLYKPWTQKPIERVATPGQATFFGLTDPDQLLISEGRIVALTDTGNMPDRGGEKYVRLYSLETGNPLMLDIGNGQQVERALSAGTKSPDVKLRLVGSRLYAISQDACSCYDLDNPNQHESFYGQDNPSPPVWNVFLGKEAVVAIGDNNPDEDNAGNAPPANAAAVPQPPAAPRPSCSVYIYGRYQLKSGESTKLDYEIRLANPAGITNTWQSFDGGVCYLTGDHKLHLLLGTKE